MRLYMDDRVPAEVRQIAQRLGLIIRLLPDLDLGIDPRGRPRLVSCHVLARALAPLYPGLHVVDGCYGMVDHSWLFYRAPRAAGTSLGSSWIIDVYPVGIATDGPLIVDFHVPGQSTLIYNVLRKPRGLDITPDFEDAVETLAEQARRLNSVLPPIA